MRTWIGASIFFCSSSPFGAVLVPGTAGAAERAASDCARPSPFLPFRLPRTPFKARPAHRLARSAGTSEPACQPATFFPAQSRLSLADTRYSAGGLINEPLRALKTYVIRNAPAHRGTHLSLEDAGCRGGALCLLLVAGPRAGIGEGAAGLGQELPVIGPGVQRHAHD